MSETTLKYKFYDVYEHKYFKWKGNYTAGFNSCRGTQVVFRPSSLVMIPNNVFHYGMEIDEIEDFFAKVEQDFPNYKNTDSMFDFYGDFNVRGNSITEIIDILNCDIWSTYKADSDDLAREYGDVLTDYFLSLFSDSQSIKIIGESADYILLLKPDEIIKELEKINTFAKSQNVTFHWI